MVNHFVAVAQLCWSILLIPSRVVPKPLRRVIITPRHLDEDIRASWEAEVRREMHAKVIRANSFQQHCRLSRSKVQIASQ